MLFQIDSRILSFMTMVFIAMFVGLGVSPRSATSSLETLLPSNTIVRVLPAAEQKAETPSSWSGGTDSEQWCAELLPRLGLSVQKQAVGACVAWVRAEGTFQTINNPLNTTQEMPGASCYNHVCVRVFQSREDGLLATVKTFTYKGHGYEAILAGLASNNGDETARAIEVSDWGTGGRAVEVWNEIKGNYQ